VNVRRVVIGFAKLALAVGVLAWLLDSGRISFREFADVADGIVWIISAQVIFCTVQFMSAVRWKWLLAEAEIHCSLLESFKLTLGGLFFNQVFFGATGGDIYRAVALKLDQRGDRARAAVSVMLDRIIGLYATILLVPVAALANMSLASRYPIIQLVVGGMLVLLLLTPALFLIGDKIASKWLQRDRKGRNNRISKFLNFVSDAYKPYRRKKMFALKILLFSILIQALIIITNIFLAFGLLGVDIQWGSFFLLIPIAHLAMAVPINPPGALGTGEALYSFLLGMADISQGAAISLLQRATNIIWSILGWIAIVFSARAGPSVFPEAVTSLDPRRNNAK